MKTVSCVFVLLTVTFISEVQSNFENVNQFKIDWENIKLANVIPKAYQFNLSLKTRSSGPVTGRIIGGENADVGEHPYHVGIVPNFGAWCGGALISDEYVLTAAHCTYECSYVYMYLGAHNIRDEAQLQNSYQVKIEQIIHHPDWDFSIFANDLSLIPIPGKIQLTDRIQPIALPSRSDDELDIENEYVTATGWGYISEDAVGIHDILQEAQLKITPLHVCQHFYRFVIETSLCTDTGLGKGLCTRDDGGPLAYTRNDGKRILVGINSFMGYMGCVSGWPVTHTRVSKYLDWISEITKIPIQN